MGERHIITGTAQVGPIELRLFPHVYDYDERPWAVGALCRITFTIGELTTTKRVTQRFAWHDPQGWPYWKRPPETEIKAACQAVLCNLRTHIARHGFDPGPLTAALRGEGDAE